MSWLQQEGAGNQDAWILLSTLGQSEVQAFQQRAGSQDTWVLFQGWEKRLDMNGVKIPPHKLL